MRHVPCQTSSQVHCFGITIESLTFAYDSRFRLVESLATSSTPIYVLFSFTHISLSVVCPQLCRDPYTSQHPFLQVQPHRVFNPMTLTEYPAMLRQRHCSYLSECCPVSPRIVSSIASPSQQLTHVFFMLLQPHLAPTRERRGPAPWYSYLRQYYVSGLRSRHSTKLHHRLFSNMGTPLSHCSLLYKPKTAPTRFDDLTPHSN